MDDADRLDALTAEVRDAIAELGGLSKSSRENAEWQIGLLRKRVAQMPNTARVREALDRAGGILAVLRPRHKNAGHGGGPATGLPPRDDLSARDYSGVFEDSDEDEIPDVDDAEPRRRSTQRVEEGSLAGEVGYLLKVRDAYVASKNRVEAGLAGLGIQGAQVKGRVKAPVSILNKLVRKHLEPSGSEPGLTDLAGTAIVVPSIDALRYAVSRIQSGALGKVIEEEDHYVISERSRHGDPTKLRAYKAVHFLVEVNGHPVEVQVKTSRQSALADLAHEPYKRVRPKSPEAVAFNQRLMQLTEQAERADAGDLDAAVQIDTALSSPAALADWIAHGR